MNDTQLTQKNHVAPKQQRSLEEKQRHYNAWKKSKLSRKEYCRHHQLSPKTFSGWVKQFEQMADGEMAFVSMPFKQQDTTENQSLEIKLPNGILCRFSQAWDKEHVMSIVRNLHAIGH